eukprot:XP_001710294.1 Hypothetical protein GL50803_103711 [Giardia lamblia ATCC 50803]
MRKPFMQNAVSKMVLVPMYYRMHCFQLLQLDKEGGTSSCVSLDRTLTADNLICKIKVKKNFISKPIGNLVGNLYSKVLVNKAINKGLPRHEIEVWLNPKFCKFSCL